MKLYNVTAQVSEISDVSGQSLFLNQVVDGSSSEEALNNFKLHFPSIQYKIVKIYSIEEIPPVVA